MNFMSFTGHFGFFHKGLAQGVRGAVDFILPPRCIISGELVDRQGMIDPAVWSGIDFISAPFCVCCGYPFAFAVADETQCASCLAAPPAFASARAALAYSGVARDLVLRFKHADQIHALASFVPWLTRAGAGMLAEADYLVPVPLHRWRLLRRRYNQAALLALALGRHCGLPVLPDGLRRIRATPTQGYLGAKERRDNVKNAFAASPRHDLAGKTIVLVDDVLTTGATATECVKILHKAGAARVHVLALARVVRAEN